MKTASIPSIRVAPELREDAERVLQEGESLSSFVEQSIRSNIAHRQIQQEFIARGLASRDEAGLNGEYFSSDEVLKELDEMLARSESADDA